jgi:hypothetical protein
MLLGFIHKVLNLLLPPEDNESYNIRRLRTYLEILNQYMILNIIYGDLYPVDMRQRVMESIAPFLVMLYTPCLTLVVKE